MATLIKQKVDLTTLNAELYKQGLPVASSVSIQIPNTAISDSSSSNLVGTIAGTVFGIVAFLGLMGVGVRYYLIYDKRSREELWKIKPLELTYDSPPVLLGRGTFGVVLQAEYRGTAVAVKRVIPPATKTKIMSQSLIFSSTANSAERTSNSTEINSAALPDYTTSVPNRRTSTFVQSSRIAMTGHSGKQGSKGSLSPSRPSVLNESTEISNAPPVARTEMQNSAVSRSFQFSPLAGMSNSHIRKSDQTMQPWQTTNRSFAGSNPAVVNSLYSDPSNSKEWKIIRMLKCCGHKHENEYRKELFSRFIDEMCLLSKLRHPCITTVMGAVIPSEKNAEPQLVMELMRHGSLFDLLHNDTLVLEGDILLSIMRDIVSGMRFLHAAEPPVIHGDLKAANVLIDENFKAKVADFGLSQKRQMGMVGTPFWMAPELLRGENCTRESDVYAFGIMIYEIFSRKVPYENEDAEDVLAKIKANIEKRPEIPDGCPPLVEAMMIECWHHDPSVRPTFYNLGCRVSIVDLNEFTNLVLEKVQRKKDFLAVATRASRASTVLHDVFPKHIAEALVAGRKIEPESKEVVTIFFSDIVGFTTISSTLPPEKVSFMLDRLYQKFDELSYINGVFKVETIGGSF